MSRCYYHANIDEFINTPASSILGELVKEHAFDLEEQQRNAWNTQIYCLKEWLQNIDGHICFEYSIPRMGKRIDCVVISGGSIFAIEFKVGSSLYENHAIEQVVDYALDLKNFHAQSHHRSIIPILVCTEALKEKTELDFDDDGVAQPVLSNGKSLEKIILSALTIQREVIEPIIWINSTYKPTPTIIEAAQALYRGHSVDEISRSDAGAENLSKTAQAIFDIIDVSKKNQQKSICFITGVPGSGKTLAGLNIANSWHQNEKDEHAVFLSGNGPLVEVLREALARNDVKMAEEVGKKEKKNVTLSKAKAFIQNIHHFRDDALEDQTQPPLEHVVIFDEAQRAWTQKQTAAFMKIKKGRSDFKQSEPEFLISVLDRHPDWATIICLVGGGQEINTGEAGLREWFDSLKRSFPHWKIYISDHLSDHEYTQGQPLYSKSESKNVLTNRHLHLSVSIRSYRSEKVASFVKALLDCETDQAKLLYQEVTGNYPILVTRDFDRAKSWLKEKARGSERYGLVASSGGLRLKPYGINVKYSIDPRNWFLNDKSDIRSSYFLEDAATEFDIQGLEVDWTCVAWDADFRHNGNHWVYKSFRGTKWQEIRDPNTQMYLKNAYRVLLTRARQGMIIFIPYGSEEDETRRPSFYDCTYNYLRSIGIRDASS